MANGLEYLAAIFVNIGVKILNVALVGYGYWGRILKRYIDQDRDMHLLKICYPSAVLDDIFTNNIQDVIEDRAIEAVFVATPIPTHYAIVKALLAGNKHVFCEKPLARRVSQAQELARIASENKRVLYTDYIYLESRAIQKIGELLPAVGNIQYVEAQIRQFGEFYKDENVYEILASHLIAVMLYLFPCQQFVIQYHDLVRNSSGQVEVGKITLSGIQIKAEIVASLKSAVKARNLYIIGSRGLLGFDMMSDKTVLLKTFKEQEGFKSCIENETSYYFNENDNLKFSLQHFKESVRGERISNTELSVAVTGFLEQHSEDGQCGTV